MPTILGRRVAICLSMPSIGAGKNSVVFYSPDYFISRRTTKGVYLRVYRESPGLVENGLIALEGWLRADSNFLHNAQTAGAVLQQHS